MHSAEPGWTLAEALAFYNKHIAADDPRAPVLVEVMRTLAASPHADAILAVAGEGWLTLCWLGTDTAADAWLYRAKVDVRAEADEIEACLEDLGEYPDDLDPDLWSVELWRHSRDEETGHDVSSVCRTQRCAADAREIAQAALTLLCEE